MNPSLSTPRSTICDPTLGTSAAAPALLLQHFGYLADTPDAVTKLRALILDLAIRGALVPQDLDDPPALQLVESAKAKLEKQRKPQQRPGGEAAESPFTVPPNWCWTCLDDLGDTAPRNDLPEKTEVGFSPMRLVTTKLGDPITFERRPWSEVRKGFTHFANGDVVVAKITPCFENGKSGVIRGAPNGYGAGTTELHVFRPVPDCALPDYALVFLKSPHFLVNGEKHMTGSAGQKRVPWDYFAKRAFPLPPLREQRRIVAKVEELLALCDELEARQTTAREHRARLVHSALDHLTAAKNEPDFRNRASFVLHESPFVLEDVPSLHQAILSLAVRGKLVCQDPDDEPAEALLVKLKAELCSATNSNELLPLSRNTSTTDPSEFHYPVPENWVWCELQEISLFLNGKAHEQLITSRPGYVLVNSRFVSNSGEISFKYAKERLSPLDTGDIVIVMSDVPSGRALARCFVINADQKYTLNQRIGCIRTSRSACREYLALVLDRNPYFLQYDDGKKQTNLRKIEIVSCPVPLPPLAEQKRIVAKVEDLMRWCDQLEAQLATAQNAAAHLLDAILRQIIENAA